MIVSFLVEGSSSERASRSQEDYDTTASEWARLALGISCLTFRMISRTLAWVYV